MAEAAFAAEAGRVAPVPQVIVTPTAAPFVVLALPSLSAPALTAPGATAVPSLAPSAAAPLSADASIAAPSTEADEIAPGLSSVAGAAADEPRTAAAPAAGGIASPSETASDSRGRWERFWSGSRFGPAMVPVVASLAVSAPIRAHALTASVPTAAKSAGFHLVPAAGAGLVFVGAYGVDRGLRWVIAKAAGSRLEAHQLAAARLTARVVVWTAAAYLALAVGGASPQVMTTALGTGGTVLTLGLRDMLGNLLQGLSFLFARPFTVGDTVQIDDHKGNVTELSLSGIAIKMDDGARAKVRYSTLGAKAPIVFGAFAAPAPQLHLLLPRKPKFAGATRAVWKSLDLGFWLSAAGFAGLAFLPHLLPVLAVGAAGKAVGAGLAATLAWLTHRVDHAFTKAVDALADSNDWRVEARLLGRLGVHLLTWTVGGGAALRMVGLSWKILAASFGLTTVVLGIASNNFFGSVVLGVETMFSRRFRIGDRVRVGTFEGAVVDMNFSYVVIQLDENRRLQVPYAVVRDSVVVVQTGITKK